MKKLMLNKITRSLGLVLLTIVLVAPVSANWRGEHPQVAAMFHQLDLSREQKMQIRSLLKEQRQQHKREGREQAHRQLKALIDGDNYDSATALQLATQQVQKKSEKGLEQAQLKHQLWQVLTAEQQTQWQELQTERAQRERPEPKDRPMPFDLLSLSDEQQQQLDVLKQNAEQNHQAHKTLMKQIRSEIKAVVQSADYSDEQVTQIYASYQPQLIELAKAEVKFRYDSWHLLTQEQQEELKSLCREFKQDKRDGFKHQSKFQRGGI
ncbi:Spy/CpxP family protein refolding chaperone [Neptunicella marina]|uniref:Spy/CpxP family protein refolding chaperone n=1 Tax=Neptunicella marina TaxID=2125989 RepID=A0A8J6M427_9ALTE|nr:Spy/CpxP family protein refolding chaperone [Neptunicella marina]MBC3767632.1 Spy/CpxP family protein refolding chaperone [Neptunicella marina]